MTTIEWTQRTWNPVRGCSRVSPGCDNCYAMRQAHRFSGNCQPYEGLTTIRRGKVDWTGSVRFVPEMLEVPLQRKPTTWFVNSMSDLFHESLTNEQIAAVFGVMAATHQHTYQILTKRPQRMRDWFAWVGDDGLRWSRMVAAIRQNYPHRPALGRRVIEGLDSQVLQWPLTNVWLGVSCEDQARANERIPLLLETPATVRFVSAEPLLGPIDLTRLTWGNGDFCNALRRDSYRGGLDSERLDWVIVGGESGPGARPCDVEWIRSIVRQCREAGTACFVKQLGSRLGLRDPKGGDCSEWPEDLRVRETPEA